MKRLFAAAIASIMISGAAMAAEPADTLLMVKNPSNVTLTENSKGLNVVVKGTPADKDFVTSYTHEYTEGMPVKTHQVFRRPLSFRYHAGWDLNILAGGIALGFTDALGAEGGMSDCQMGKSFEIALPELVMVNYNFGRNSIGAGFELGWRNYRMTGRNCFALNDEGRVEVVPFGDDADGKYSRLKVFTLGFPIAYHYTSPIKLARRHYLKFGFAVSLNYNTHGSLRTEWTDAEGRDCTFKSNHIGQRKFTTDLTLGVGTAGIGFYVKYSPMDVLEDGAGPSFRSLSTGIRIGF